MRTAGMRIAIACAAGSVTQHSKQPNLYEVQRSRWELKAAGFDATRKVYPAAERIGVSHTRGPIHCFGVLGVAPNGRPFTSSLACHSIYLCCESGMQSEVNRETRTN